MLDSLKKQLQKEDHLTIVFDGHSKVPEFSYGGFSCAVHLCVEPVNLGFWGHGIRNKQAPLLQPTTFVMHADDDDIQANQTFEKLRHICVDPETVYIAQMRGPRGQVLPDSKSIVETRVGTPCGIIPWTLNQKATFEPVQTGDYFFYKQLESEAKMEFLNLIIQHIRPDLGTFNAWAQADRYHDLKKAYGYNADLLLKHWKSHGIREGRKASLQ